MNVREERVAKVSVKIMDDLLVGASDSELGHLG